MENNSKKFISRQMARMLANVKKARIIFVICAVLGIVSMVFALIAADKRGDSKAPASAPKAPTVTESPFTEGNFTYELRNGVLSLEAYNGSDSVVSIPSVVRGYPVRSIGDHAFTGNRTLSSVHLPSTVQSIGSSSFSSCTILAEVRIAEGLQEIGSNAFAGCSMLRTITLPDSFRTAYPSTFRSCADSFMLYVSEGSAGETFAKSNGYIYEYVTGELIG